MFLDIALLVVLVRPGDTLSGIAAAHGDSLVAVEDANRWILARSGSYNLIYPGWDVSLPEGRWVRTEREPDHDPDDGFSVASHPAVSGGYGGTLSYTGLEALWEAAGGARWAAPHAACIAERESGGRQDATGPYGERGYWQINPDHGYLSTYDPLGNAKAAVIISGDGTNWSPWTTAYLC